ncbi:hypothetical protein M404DRAFT_827147 [Pisolithus tinctorius Marx 270]|uniref:Uncharacterized protein n=1 Tax=Pisolithus tinctorius Marx 270 TaxID=870435 RepID=A0A0C3JMF0_PISTI|nr:hypothetical protein M404DRAFT_827147 [Pisolithus tinctorius Marx 270]
MQHRNCVVSIGFSCSPSALPYHTSPEHRCFVPTCREASHSGWCAESRACCATQVSLTTSPVPMKQLPGRPLRCVYR